MAKPSSSVYARVGRTPEERLRWLLKFGNLEPVSLNADGRAVAVQEARAFLMVEEVDPEVRALLRIGPPPIDETPNVLTQDEVWAAIGEPTERLCRACMFRRARERGIKWCPPPPHAPGEL